MESKKFLYFRITIIFLSVVALLLIEFYQRKLIKEEKIIEEKNIVTEDTLIDAAKLYISNNPDYFAEIVNEKDIEVRINTSKLVKSKLIDNNDSFKGYVMELNNEFSFVRVNNMMIDNINTKDYYSGVNNEKNAYDLKYIYKGENPNNYIKYNGKLYRIIGITNSGNAKAIETENTNLDYWGLSGDINYLKNDQIEADIKNKGIFYVGYVRSSSSSIDKIMKNEKRNNTYTVSQPKLYYNFSYVNISDIINASDKCEYSKINEINNNICNSYLLSMLNNTYTSTASENDMVYKVNEKNEIITSKLEKNINVKKVIYINLYSEYMSGNGTLDNPYEIK